MQRSENVTKQSGPWCLGKLASTARVARLTRRCQQLGQSYSCTRCSVSSRIALRCPWWCAFKSYPTSYVTHSLCVESPNGSSGPSWLEPPQPIQLHVLRRKRRRGWFWRVSNSSPSAVLPQPANLLIFCMKNKDCKMNLTSLLPSVCLVNQVSTARMQTTSAKMTSICQSWFRSVLKQPLRVHWLRSRNSDAAQTSCSLRTLSWWVTISSSEQTKNTTWTRKMASAHANVS